MEQQDSATILIAKLYRHNKTMTKKDTLISCGKVSNTEHQLLSLDFAGPSGLDAASWRHICTSFQRVPSDLCDALSAARRLLLSLWILLVCLPGYGC